MDARDQPNRPPELAIADLVIAVETSDDVIAALHELAAAELEFLFAAREHDAGDVVLVARNGGEPVGYIAATDAADGRTMVWEHLVVPDFRNRGVGRALLGQLAGRLAAPAVMVIDPIGTLDPERVADYYKACGFEIDPASGQMRGIAGAIAAAAS